MNCAARYRSRFGGLNNVNVRRQVFWGNWRRELTEALAHQGFDIRRPLLDEASGAV